MLNYSEKRTGWKKSNKRVCLQSVARRSQGVWTRNPSARRYNVKRALRNLYVLSRRVHECNNNSNARREKNKNKTNTYTGARVLKRLLLRYAAIWHQIGIRDRDTPPPATFREYNNMISHARPQPRLFFDVMWDRLFFANKTQRRVGTRTFVQSHAPFRRLFRASNVKNDSRGSEYYIRTGGEKTAAIRIESAGRRESK